ncbi:MAG: hypothetical protein ACOYOH_21455 [Paracraurococcus sp.]
MSARFVRARIVPFDAAGKTPVEAEAVPFDFNPETLTFKVTAGKAKDKARKGKQQVQHVADSEATLAFEAIFDSSRPRDGEDGRATQDGETLDVRLRTRPLAGLIQAVEPQGGNARQQPAPKRVQFRWGSIVFNGVISAYQETFDYFSPEGVPLRSKLAITITEQEFRYEIDSAERARLRAATPPAPAGLRDAADAAAADSLFDMGSGGLSLGLSLDASFGVSAGISLGLELGIRADFGVSASVGISLEADAAIDLFGSAALGGGGTAGRAGLPAARAAAAGAASPWAPDGPAPGSRAAGLAAVVAAQRAAGLATTPPMQQAAGLTAAPRPLPVRGSPPPLLPRAPGGAVPMALRSVPRGVDADGERRPRWESLALPAPATAAPARHAAHTGCGCARYCGGG